MSVIPNKASYTLGETIQLSATPDSANIFIGWYGDISSTANPCTLVITKNLTIEARFAKMPSGMAKISSAGKTFSMGSASSKAVKDIESPVHQVRFTYDFYMDPYEVTQGQYSSIVGTNPVSGRGYPDIGDSLPVFEVSWYDAALYCNEMSRRRGYDTVYSYTAVCSGNQVCPYVLENLEVHYDRFGYRLPTEAEWEYACRGGTAADFYWGNAESDAGAYTWYFDNSQNMTHAVGRKLPNAYGLYDMSGNVAEWVNDWLGTYSDTLVENPVGPRHLPLEQFESSWERPVRGGSFDLSASYMRSSARRLGPYETAAKLPLRIIVLLPLMGEFFVGDSSGYAPDSSTDSITFSRSAEKSSLLSFVGTSDIKLVFTQQTGMVRKLYCIDFSQADLTPFVVAETLGCYSPAISPNGAYVAYSSAGEGRSGPSMVFVRPLDRQSTQSLTTEAASKAYLPRWWVDTAGADTFLIYTDGASANSSAQWRNEKTYRRKMAGLGFGGAAEVLWGAGSYHGGLSADGRFLATGYTRARVVDLQLSDTTLLYFPSPYNGREDDGQVCNVSISPGREFTDEILLLDFGYSKTSTIVGKPYGLHAIIFKCNSKVLTYDHVVSWYEKPLQYKSWNHVEYTNHPYFAVATAHAETTGHDDGLYLISLQDSTYLQLVTGQGLRDPWLWIDPGQAGEAPDEYADFAKYDLPFQAGAQEILTKKLKLMWKRRTELEGIFFGSSPAYHGIHAGSITSVCLLSAATKSSDIQTSATCALHYALVDIPSLKVIALALDPGMLDADSVLDPPYLTGLYDSKGYAFDKANNFWRAGIPSEIETKIAAFDSASSWAAFDSTGFYYKQYPAGGWDNLLYDQGDYAFADKNVQKSLALVQQVADSAAAKGVHVLVVNFPQSPGYKASAQIGRLGPSWSTYAQIETWLRNLESANSYFHFYDAHAGGDHDYSGSDAYDCNHLSYAGAVKLSTRIDSVMQTFLP